MTAPAFRAVDAHTGTIAERDRLIRERDDAVAERDNMVNFGREVGRLSDYLRHMIADRDEFRDMYLEYRDKYEGAQVRMDEMAAEIRELTEAIDRAASR